MVIRPVDFSERSLYDGVVRHPMQMWSWGDFRQSTGVDVERYGVFEGKNILSGLQVTFHPIPHTGMTMGYFPKGPMPDEEQLLALKELGKRKNALAIKMEPNVASPVGQPTAFPQIQQFLADHGAVSGKPLFTRYTFILDLTPSEQELLAGMRPKTRYNVSLAERKGVTVVQDDSEAGLEEYLNILKETTARQQFYAHGPEYFRKMWHVLGRSGNAHILKAQAEGRTVAAWILFVHKGVLYYPYGASSNEFREYMPSNLLMWRAIQLGKSWGCTSFDMWGALGPEPSSSDPWFGFHRFKQGYGSVLHEFVGTYDLVLNAPMYKLFTLADSIRWKILRSKAYLSIR